MEKLTACKNCKYHDLDAPGACSCPKFQFPVKCESYFDYITGEYLTKEPIIKTHRLCVNLNTDGHCDGYVEEISLINKFKNLFSHINSSR